MKTVLVIILVSLFDVAMGQTILYRHDSLFVNAVYIDAYTTKSTLDSLLKTKGKTKYSKDLDKINPSTGKKVLRTTDFYYELGLFFRRYDYDMEKLSVGIKLKYDTDPKEDRQNELKGVFIGQLYIGDNYMNDKITIDQLSQLKGCQVTVSGASLGTYSTIIGGDIIYEENIIRISFDRSTSEMKSVFIHHNFKER